MIDITTFLEKNSIKDICRLVYVNNAVAVATDSFKLIEIKLDDHCTENIPNGYYEISAWKKMCKAYNAKKQDLKTFMEEIVNNNTTITKHKDEQYPDYEKILNGEFNDLDLNSCFTKKHLITFIEILPEMTYQIVNLSDIKDNGKMIKFENDEMRVVLMKCDPKQFSPPL